MSFHLIGNSIRNAGIDLVIDYDRLKSSEYYFLKKLEFDMSEQHLPLQLFESRHQFVSNIVLVIGIF